jgi:hypothetical protein
MYTYGTALMDRIKTGQRVELTFPPFTYNDGCDVASAVCIPSGPAADLAVPMHWDLTGVLALATTGESRIFKAGQASFNPKHVSSQNNTAGNFAVNASIVKATFSDACASLPDPSKSDSNPCAPCYSDIEAALLNGPAVAGKVAIVSAVEVICIGSYKSIVDLLARKRALGVLVASVSGTFTMHAETGYVSSIPAFSIAASDAAWILERVIITDRTVDRRGGSRAGGVLSALASYFAGRVHDVVERVRGTESMPAALTAAGSRLPESAASRWLNDAWLRGVESNMKFIRSEDPAGDKTQAAFRPPRTQISVHIDARQSAVAGQLGLREAIVGGKGVSALLPKLEEVCLQVEDKTVCVGKAPSYEVQPR